MVWSLPRRAASVQRSAALHAAVPEVPVRDACLVSVGEARRQA